MTTGILASRVLESVFEGTGSRRIPILMSHGIDSVPRSTENGYRSLSAVEFDALYRIARELDYETIGYDELEKWLEGTGSLPRRPLMIDFDHPTITMRYDVNDIMQRYGFRPTLFINTAGIEAQAKEPLPKSEERQFMTWDEVGDLLKAGWRIGAHTVNHPNLSDLSIQDPTGARIVEELDQSNEIIESRLGLKPRDFAYTGTSFSTQAEREIRKRYRFGRLWIVNSQYNMDGKRARMADVMGIAGADEADGGPPRAARYITRNSNRYRLPSMDTNHLIHDQGPFRRYLEEANI
ncbi:polysaccharide deacetylase family protein [Bradyrhizobium macuxiense]|nr:polysaccharide deacetylase family protein [Bradyrhizobium macuxiense]